MSPSAPTEPPDAAHAANAAASANTANAAAAELSWNIADIYPTNDAWEEAYVALGHDLPQLAAFSGELGQSPERLVACLQLRDSLYERCLRLHAFASLGNDADTTDSTTRAMRRRVTALFAKLAGEAAFIDPEILQIPEETLRTWIAGHGPLAPYAYALETILREKPHVLSTAEEQLLAMGTELADAPEDIYNTLNDADLTFPVIKGEDGRDVQLTHGNYITQMESAERSVRQAAFEAYMSTYDKVGHTMGATLGAQVAKDVYLARAHKFDRAIEAALFPHNVPVAVYDNLLSAVHDALPLLHRYMAVRQRILGLEQLHMYDIYAPLVEMPKQSISFADARRQVLAACKPLGEPYTAALEEGLRARWIDVPERPGKRSGAYSMGVYGVHPYVLLNWQDNLNSLFTLAHEMGHAMHSHFSSQTQDFVNHSYSIFVAEVASTTNELLLLRHLLGEARDRQARLYLLNHHLEKFRATVFRQAMFAEFERLIHDEVEGGGALTTDRLNEMYAALNQTYHGPEMAADPEIALEWMRIPHFYLNFYVYQYATGLCAATALERGISGVDTDDAASAAAARERYVKFLTLGGSMDPIDELRLAGVDMTSPDPMRAGMKAFEESLVEFEASV